MGTEPTLRPRQLGYVELPCRSVASVAAYLQRYAHLHLVEQEGSGAYLTGNADYQWFVLDEAASRGVLAYEMASPKDLDARRSKLELAGVRTEDSADPNVTAAFEFDDPDGLRIRLYAGMRSRTIPDRPAWVHHERLLHAGISVSDAARSVEFYSEQLGFRVSDYAGTTGAFLRAGNGFHHSLVVLARGNPRIEHVCILTASFDDLMRARQLALEDKLSLRHDLVRHTPSGSVATYIDDQPDLPTIELCVWHELVDEHTWRPKVYDASPWGLNVWTPPRWLASNEVTQETS